MRAKCIATLSVCDALLEERELCRSRCEQKPMGCWWGAVGADLSFVTNSVGLSIGPALDLSGRSVGRPRRG